MFGFGKENLSQKLYKAFFVKNYNEKKNWASMGVKRL